MKCFYHSADLDGHCSGAIIKKKFPECEMIGINYGDEFPWDKIHSNEVVFMVDFSLQPFHLMTKLNNSCDLRWIDHHISAIGDYHKENIEIDGLRNNEFAGCELTWQYINPNTTMPKAVELLGRFDVWKHDSHPDIVPFQYGMQQFEDTTHENWELWSSLLSTSFKEFLSSISDEGIKQIVQDGKLIQKYQDARNKKMCQSYSFETVIDGHKAIAINTSMVGSQIFDSVYDESKYDLMMPFSRKLGFWTASLYSTKEGIDCSKIAKKYGGGGHKGAAGFQCKKLPFKV